MTEFKAILIALRMVIFFLGFFLGMVYITWVKDDMAGMILFLFIAAIIAWAWILTERDVKEKLK